MNTQTLENIRKIDERKWHEKIRYLLPVLTVPTFLVIIFFWNQYPQLLLKQDNQIFEKFLSPSNSNWSFDSLYLQTYQNGQISNNESKLEYIGNKYGTYGDSYGSLNTLFTGLAFAGLIISIIIQLIELRQTRKELSGQREALADQEKQLKKQTAILKNQNELTSFQHIEAIKQNFYHQFYALMEERRFRLQNLAVHKDLTYDPKTNTEVFSSNFKELGIPAFKVYLQQIETKLHSTIGKVKADKQENPLFRKHLYISFDSLKFSQISSIINLTDNLLTTIKGLNNNISTDKKIDLENYLNMVASSLYPEEAAIIFWYGIISPGWKELIEETALLRYFSYGHAEELVPIFYDVKAFGENDHWKSIYEKFKTTQQ